MSLFGKKEIMESLGVDIGTSSVKVVQLKKEKGKIILVTYGEVSLGAYAGLDIGQPVHLGDEKLIEAIQSLFKEAKVTCKEASVSLDPASSYVSMITIPKVNDSELDAVILLEARRYIPVPITDVTLDWWHLPESGHKIDINTRSLNIVIAAVKNETIETYSRVIKKLGLSDVDFEIEGFSIVRSTLQTTMQNNSGMFLCLDIGSQYSTVSLIRSHVVLDMNIIAHGSQESTTQLVRALSLPMKTAEETKRAFGYLGDKSNPYVSEIMELSSYPLFGEVVRLSLMYERKYNQTIEGVILSGGGARLPGVLEAYKKMVHIEARIATPFDQVEVPAFLKEMIDKLGPSYSVAVGLALKKLTS